MRQLEPQLRRKALQDLIVRVVGLNDRVRWSSFGGRVLAVANG
jgi:hypothetical protein